MQHRPNILWISTHDINPHLGAYAGVYPGAEAAVTPNLDRLAAEGARFDRAFATAPVCAPARSSIVTGMFPTAIGTMHMRTRAVPPPEVRLLPEYFREAGYYVTNNWFTDFQVEVPAPAYDDCSPTAHWRNRPDPGRPFFAEFHGLITHESQIYLDDDEFAQRTSHVPQEARHDPDTVTLPPYHPDTPVFRRSWARYLDLITEMDHGVGELLAQLEEDGLAEDTIVVFWSDHGLGMPRGKRWAYDSGLHEPLIMRWPGVVAPGTVRDELVHVMDLAPTMLAAAGIAVPEHMQAVPFLRDGDWVGIESRAGHTVLRAKVSTRMQPGVVYTTFHFPESGANVITTEASDWATNCPEYKVTAVEVSHVQQPSEWQREYSRFNAQQLDLLDRRATADTTATSGK